MLALNNPLLTSERILSYFRKEVIGPVYDPLSKAPSSLSILKNKLKANFFNELVGCDFVMTSIDDQTDLNLLPQKVPALLKRGEHYFLGKFEKDKWILTELDGELLENIGLHFPSVGLIETLPYQPDKRNLYEYIVSKNSKINLNKIPTDAQILEIIAKDPRFSSAYPKLKFVLSSIFSLTDEGDMTQALERLNAFEDTDWDISDASSQWSELNSRFGCFDKSSPALLDLFKELAVSCRTMIVLMEKNNTADDKLAYEYAYKLMSLFVDPSTLTTKFDVIATDTNKLLTKSDRIKQYPFHDVLMDALTLPNMSGLDRKGWYELFKKEGEKTFPFLKVAKQMEDTLVGQTGGVARAPKSLLEAKEIDLYRRYPRAVENPRQLEFAKLCYQYDVDLSRYNRGIEYMASGWPKKKEIDSIPDQIIIGKPGTPSDGYYWVKVPREDMRSLIMGDITGCCQSIGGKSSKSEQCVMDSVSLNDNCIYVLLKKQSKKADARPIIDNEINDKDFQIIGQSYIWKSQTGNLCLDSIEVLKGSVSQNVLGEIVTEFANSVLAQDETIKFVTLGAGGKTPYLSISPAAIPEKMRQGYDYGDADRQFCIAKTSLSGFSMETNDALDQLLEEYPRSFKRAIHYLKYYMCDKEHFVSNLAELIGQYPQIVEDLNERSLFRLLSLTQSPSINDLRPVNIENLIRLSDENKAFVLKDISVAQLFWRESAPLRVLSILPLIDESKRLDVVLIKNGLGQSLLHLSIDDPTTFIAILNMLPEHLRMDALMAKDASSQSVLNLIRSNEPMLAQVLSVLPADKRISVLERDSDFEGSFGMYGLKTKEGDDIYKPKLTAFMKEIGRKKAVGDSSKQDKEIQMDNVVGIKPLSGG